MRGASFAGRSDKKQNHYRLQTCGPFFGSAGSSQMPPWFPLRYCPHLRMCDPHGLAVFFFLPVHSPSDHKQACWSTSHGACNITFPGTGTNNCWSQPALIFGIYWKPHTLFPVHGPRRVLRWCSSQEVEVRGNHEGFTYTRRRRHLAHTTREGLPLGTALDQFRGSLPSPSAPSGTGLCPIWHDIPRAGTACAYGQGNSGGGVLWGAV